MQEAQTIQGLNLESPTTQVRISNVKNSENLLKLLNLIQGFHPIFIENYKLEDNTLTITSKLPAIWRESADTFIQLSKDEITYDQAQSYILDTVIKQKVKSMSTIPILHKAHELGYETTLTISDEGIIPGVENGFGYKWNRYYTLGCGKGSQVTCSISSTKDSTFGKNIQQDKWTTNKIIERMGLPLPKWDILISKEDIDTLWDQYEKPLVIKPTGLTGGSGVTVGIEDKEKAYKAFDYAKSQINLKVRSGWQTKIMIQEQVEGHEDGSDYRLLVINGKLKICTKRIPAFVIGDGKSNIKELIEETNKDPRRNTSDPSHILKPIEFDEPLTSFLEKQGFTLESVPPKDKKTYVRNVASMSKGGITEDFTKKVSPEIKSIVESIASTMHVFALGADIMCKDISKPLDKSNGAILEVNTMPESYLNFFPVIGEQQTEALDYYVKSLLNENTTQRIVVIGQLQEDIPTLLRKKLKISDDQNVGVYKDRKILINNSEFNNDIEPWKGIEALKVNASLDTIILQYRDLDEVREHGLGFDRIDTLFVTKDIADRKDEMKVFRKYKRKGYIRRIKAIK
jgi:cyanophycin synthetase